MPLRKLTDGTRVEVDFERREVPVDGVASTANSRSLFDDPGRLCLGASLNCGRLAIDDFTLGLA